VLGRDVESTSHALRDGERGFFGETVQRHHRGLFTHVRTQTHRQDGLF